METSKPVLECLSDFAARLPRDTFVQKRKALANILGVRDQNIRRWLNRTVEPIGLSLLTLSYYLELLGYQVSEVHNLHSLEREAGKLLAFKVMTLDDMASMTDYTGYPDRLLAVLRGDRSYSAARVKLLTDLVNVYADELAKKIQETPRLITLECGTEKNDAHVMPAQLPVEPSVVKHAAEVIAETEARVTGAIKRAEDVRASLARAQRFGDLVENLLSFAKFYTHGDVPKSVREELRAVAGQQKIFDLKNVLVRLCSETAFGHNAGNQ